MTDLLEILKPHDPWEAIARIVWGGILLAFVLTVVIGFIVISIEISPVVSFSILGAIVLSYLTGIFIQWKMDNKLWGRRIGER